MLREQRIHRRSKARRPESHTTSSPFSGLEVSHERDGVRIAGLRRRLQPGLPLVPVPGWLRTTKRSKAEETQHAGVVRDQASEAALIGR